MRECGDCNLCCKILNIPEYNAPSGTMCEHCTDKGCGIYEERHDICKGFSCLWLSQPQIPESLRPDKSGVLFELPAGSMTYIGHIIKEEAIENQEVLLMVEKITQAGHPVMLYQKENNKKLFKLPKGIDLDFVKNDIKKAVEKHKAEGRI